MGERERERGGRSVTGFAFDHESVRWGNSHFTHRHELSEDSAHGPDRKSASANWSDPGEWTKFFFAKSRSVVFYAPADTPS